MPLLVRTWNLFHGNAKPPERRAFLERMVRLATEDTPDVVCLQELPAWSLSHLAAWSGMHAVGEVAAPPTLGPLPSSPEIGRVLTDLHHGLLRSALTGQANAILLGPRTRPLAERSLVLNPRRFRRAQARWLGLDPVLRLAWAKERRVAQAVRVALDGAATALVVNLHATALHADERCADAELRRAAEWADQVAAPDEPVLFCGDVNVRPERSRTLADLHGAEWGFSAPVPARIDQVLVRGLPVSEPNVWPEERRRVDGRLLSDHAPVEVQVG